MYYIDFYSLFNHPEKDWKALFEVANIFKAGKIPCRWCHAQPEILSNDFGKVVGQGIYSAITFFSTPITLKDSSSAFSVKGS